MKIVKRLLLLIIGILLLLSIFSAFDCARTIKVTDYDVQLDGITNDVKLVCISDLHSKEYGEDNENLLALIAEQEPDAILIDGDMFNSDATESDIEQFLELSKRLLEIAPAYYSVGNHEVEFMAENGEEVLLQIADTGMAVLYDGYVETKIAGNEIRIGGTCGHYRDINWEKEYDYAMQETIGDTNVPALVLMHMPETMIYDSFREYWDADLYISGHTHGGIIRIPGIGGLYAPTQGMLPKYDQGEFVIDGRLKLIITSGLSGYDWVPRVFNKPEICVVTLVGKD